MQPGTAGAVTSFDVGLQPTAVGGAVVDARGKSPGNRIASLCAIRAIAIPPPPSIALPKPYCKKGRIPRGISAWPAAGASP